MYIGQRVRNEPDVRVIYPVIVVLYD